MAFWVPSRVMIPLASPTETRSLAERVYDEDDELRSLGDALFYRGMRLAREGLTQPQAHQKCIPVLRELMRRLMELRTEYIAAGGDWSTEAHEIIEKAGLRNAKKTSAAAAAASGAGSTSRASRDTAAAATSPTT